jgi:hypothetical protein
MCIGELYLGVRVERRCGGIGKGIRLGVGNTKIAHVCIYIWYTSSWCDKQDVCSKLLSRDMQVQPCIADSWVQSRLVVLPVLRNSTVSITSLHLTHLFPKVKSTSHGTSILPTHPLESLTQSRRSTKENSTIGIGVFISY